MSELVTEGEPRRKSGVWRTVSWVVAALVVYLFVVPLLPKFRDAAGDLNRIEPNLLIIGVGLQVVSLLCYSLLTRAALGEEGHKVPLLRLFRIQMSKIGRAHV